MRALEALDLVPLTPSDIDNDQVIYPDLPPFQEELTKGLRSRIRLVRTAVYDVFPSSLDDWIHDFQREPYPDREILTWEFIASLHLELNRKFSLKFAHKIAAYCIIVESTIFSPDQLAERHASAWQTLPNNVRKYLRTLLESPTPLSDDKIEEDWSKDRRQKVDGIPDY